MLRLSFANCLSERVGEHGLDPTLLASQGDLARAARAMTKRLAQTRGTGWERWRDLPFDPMRDQHLSAVRDAAETRRGRFDNLVVLGIGGSALGNVALHAALNPLTYNLMADRQRPGPRLFVVDNVDPAFFGAVLEFCGKGQGGLRRTLFNVISKSGETAETAAQFMIVRDMLRKALGAEHRDNILAVTDPAKGTMRAICDKEGYAALPVPEGVGGRFSVLSPVGLFSAEMCGIDTAALLDGAASMEQPCSDEDLSRNPAAMLAVLLVELASRHGKTNHVLMPYANGLYPLADWFRQLWAESLGKRVETTAGPTYAGFTPIKALGTTDQHSQVQLYREGPNDKVIGLVDIEDWGDADVPIPRGLGVEALGYLEGRSLAQLLAAEKRATEYALVESQRPNFTITFPRVDAYHVGQFINLWQITTAYAGLMLGINAYDQPAVELGKQATFGLMGRRGYEHFQARVTGSLAPSTWSIA
jgi:glucose-6-phosphate isomerase